MRSAYYKELFFTFGLTIDSSGVTDLKILNQDNCSLFSKQALETAFL